MFALKVAQIVTVAGRENVTKRRKPVSKHPATQGAR